MSVAAEDAVAEQDRCPVCGAAECEHTEDEQAAAQAAREQGGEPPYLASDEQQVRQKRRRQQRGEVQHIEDLRWLMRHKQGRRLMWHLLSQCGIYRSVYAVGRGEFGAMCFADGARNIGLAMHADLLAHCLEGFQQMAAENGGNP